MTIHKSQGQTLSTAVVDLGENEKSLGLTFVALSRVKKLKDLIILSFPFNRLTAIKESKCLLPRKKEEGRLKTLELQ